MNDDFELDKGEMKKVTIEEARKFKKLDKYNDEELQVILDTICELTLITHRIITQQESEKREEG